MYTEQEQYKEWKALPLSEKMRVDIAMASVYADEVKQLETTNTELLKALEELRKGIYDFTDLPVDAKNFVYRITTETIQKAKG